MLRRPITDEMMEETRLFTGRRVSEQGIGEGEELSSASFSCRNLGIENSSGFITALEDRGL